VNKNQKKFIIYHLLFITAFFSSCKGDFKEANAVEFKPNQDEGREVEVFYSDSGIVKMKLNASKLIRHSTDTPWVEYPEGMKVVFYDSLMKEDGYFTADYAIHKEKENIIEGKKNVIVVNQKGEKLNTEHLIWDKEKEMIYTNEFVKITTEDEVITGEGMEADEQFSKYKIKKIKGTVTIKE